MSTRVYVDGISVERMEKRTSIGKLIVMTAVMSLTAASCSQTGVDSLIDDYNGNFTVVSAESTSPSPGDSGFDESTMLAADYLVSSSAWLSINGPAGAESYEWTAAEEGTAEKITLCSKQLLAVYMPETPLRAKSFYTLELTVTGRDGKKYADSASLIVK
jgi:hypothetical protein